MPPLDSFQGGRSLFTDPLFSLERLLSACMKIRGMEWFLEKCGSRKFWLNLKISEVFLMGLVFG